MRAKIFAIWLISFIIGALLAPLFQSSSTVYLYIGLTLCTSAFFVYNKRYVYGLLFGVGLFLIAISLFQARELFLVSQNEHLAGKNVEISGYVSDIPVVSEYGQAATLTATEIAGVNSSIKLKTYFDRYPVIHYGQSLTFEGKVKLYGDKKWRLVKDGYVGEVNVGNHKSGPLIASPTTPFRGWLFSIRSAFNGSIQRSLPATEAGLASGLILGEKALITPEVTRQLQISGTTHIVALSGYNITIILGLFLMFKSKLSRLSNILVPVGFILIFVIMTGGAASLVRAAIMGFMPLLASYLGREGDSFMAILLSAAMMLVFNPFLALFDVGFQLSFAALAGMVYLAPLIQSLVVGLPEYISFPFSETVGAQVAATPIISYYFGMISLISPISNILILGLVPVGMLVSFLVGLAGLVWQPLANLLAIPSYVILHIINLLVGFFGSLPEASKSIKIENPIWILLIYFVLFDVGLITHKTRSTQLIN